MNPLVIPSAPSVIPSKARDLLFLLFASVCAVAYVDAGERQPQRPARTVWDSVFTANQAARGETAYLETCARCHKASLAGADESPALVGGAFLSNWSGQSVRDLHDRIRTSMPTDDPGIYSRQVVTDVMAYMFKVNGFPAGAVELSTVGDSLKDITIQSTKP
jgi:S-disulfanyl-L-cysteine oxidoreductase SoxD